MLIRVLKLASDHEKLTVAALTVLILVTWIIRIQFDQLTAIKGFQYNKLQEELERLQEENMILQTEILNFTSYGYISGHAGQFGYSEGKVIILIKEN